MPLTGNERLYVSSEGGGRATVSANEIAALAGEGAVTSVNTQTGAVVLTAADVGAVQVEGTQNIGGVKTFTERIFVPDPPVASVDAAPKGYVDGWVTTLRGEMDARFTPNQRTAVNALNPATATTTDIVNALQA